MDELNLTELYCIVDDFSKEFQSQSLNFKLIGNPTNRPRRMSMGEVITIVLAFQNSGFRTFKDFYSSFVCRQLKSYFPQLVSYSRFVRLMAEASFPIYCFWLGMRGQCTGITFLDSTILTSCHIKRAARHKTMANIAKKGKSTMGWFYGFKLHVVLNHVGEIVSFKLTPGNVNDRKPVHEILQGVFGNVYADKGYISHKLFHELFEKGIKLITGLKKNMKNKLVHLYESFFLRKRSLIESVNNLLKNDHQILHHRHRSVWGFLTNVMASITAYSMRKNKPSLCLSRHEISDLMALKSM